MSAPRTIAEVLEEVSRLRSRHAILGVNRAHLRNVYLKTDAGPPEARITREDLAFVPEGHIEAAILDIEHEMELIDVRLEELQSAPVGGGGAPAAAAALPAPQEGEALDEQIRAQVKRKGAPSGKARPQSSRPD
jgi:hypothetical protein